MTKEAMAAARADREEAIRLFSSLDASEWAAPSACDGWTVQDVVAHLASLYHPTATFLKNRFGGLEVEDLNDALVQERRQLSAEEQLEEYEVWSRRGLLILDFAQQPLIGSIPVHLPGLGRYELNKLANAVAFDLYVHLRYDILTPRGPVEREPLPSDPIRLRPVVAWMVDMLPQLSADSMSWLDRPVSLTLHGPGGGAWLVSRGSRGIAVRPGPDSAAARVVSTTPDFVGWATHRCAWRDADVEIDGDEQLAARFCDAIHLI